MYPSSFQIFLLGGEGRGTGRMEVREGVAADQLLGQDAHQQHWVPGLGN